MNLALIIYVIDKYQINTRSAANGNLFIPKLSSKTGQRSFQYRGVHAWNGLSVDARGYSLEKFKNIYSLNCFILVILNF